MSNPTVTDTYAWIKPLARGGYAARGVVYLIVGFFTLLAAVGAGQKQGTRGALRAVLEQPFGQALLWIIVVGLVGYVIWRLIQAIFDTDQHGLGPKGLAVRGGLLSSAGTYALLTLFALSAMGVVAPGGEAGPSFADRIARIVGSQWVSLGLALIFTGVAGAHYWKAFKRKYADHFQANEQQMRFIHPISQFGLVARGTIFTIIALLLAFRFMDRQESGDAAPPGLTDALTFLQQLPYGGLLLAAMGLGLMAFATYSLIEARWRRINVEDA